MSRRWMRGVRFFRGSGGADRAIRGVALLGGAWLAAGLAACASPPISLSAEIGSTILIPLGNQDANVGYGGTDYTDYQRGEMVYQLAGTGDPLVELTTRVSSAVMPHPASVLAGEAQAQLAYPGLYTIPREFFSLVDVTPSNMTTISAGTYSLIAVWRRAGQDTVVPYTGQLKILPTVGAPTPPPQNDPSLFARGIPRPRVQMALEPTTIKAFELVLSYPATVIDVVDAVYQPHPFVAVNESPVLWIDDDDAGTVKISGLVHPQNPDPSNLVWTGKLEVVFELVDGAAQILASPNDVVVQSLKAYDIDGNELASPEATMTAIR